MSQAKSVSILDARILIPAVGGAFKKLNPRALAKNPVMFVVATGSALTTVLFVRDLMMGGSNLGFSFQINLWLW
ncbi:potassium-transporting ATPase subunit B, partial [Xanthomonas citri pv. citri]